MQPVVFVGHGSPMNAIDDNAWSRGFIALGESLARPSAILAISAHWYVDGTLVTSNAEPRTIHDFSGFPRELYEIRYPASGSPELVARISELVERVRPSDSWGLDHGTWTVLTHVRPAADVPVVQLSIDRRLSPADHLAIGRALAPLRDRVLILASGNITHNLRHAFHALQTGEVERPDWAARFDREIEAALVQRDHAWLANALTTEHGQRSHPTADHYLPLLYAAGAAGDHDVTFPITGWDMGSLSMRSVRFGV